MSKLSKDKSIHLSKNEKNNCSSYLSWNNSKYDEQVFRLVYVGLYCIDKLKYNDDLVNDLIITLKKKDLEQLGFKDRKNTTKVLERIGEQAQAVGITLKENGKWKRMVLFPTIEYSKGQFKLYVNNQVIDNYKYLEDNFTQLKLSTISKLTFKETQLYLYLKSYLDNTKDKYKWTKKIEIKELKELMKCQGKYKDCKDFIRWVIKPSIKSINNLSDIEITKVEKVRGEDSIKFYFEWNRINQIKYIPPTYLEQNYEVLSEEEIDSLKEKVRD